MKAKVLTVVWLLTSWVATAQNLDQCRELARNNYPEIKQYDLIAQTEAYSVSNAKRAWIPQLVLSAQATYQSATVTYPDALSKLLTSYGMENVGIQKDQYKIALDLYQNIWDGGAAKAGEEMAKAEANVQRSSVDVNLYDLYQRVDNLYFGILLLAEKQTQTTLRMDLLRSNWEKLQSYVKNGVALQADADALQAELLVAEQQLEQLKSSEEAYRLMLSLFIGQPLANTPLERPVEITLADKSNNRPELQLLEAKFQQLEAQKDAITATVMPRFNLFAQGYYGYPGLDMFKAMSSTEWSLNGIVGVKMQWNIGSLYTYKNTIDKLNTAQQSLAVQKELFEFNTSLKTTGEDKEISRLKKALEADEAIIQLRQSIRKAAESKLENGDINTTDLLQKITDENVAIQNKVSHEIELLQAEYRLKHTLNQ